MTLHLHDVASFFNTFAFVLDGNIRLCYFKCKDNETKGGG